MNMKIRYANISDVGEIYKLGRKFVNQRIFGLQGSINDKQVWVLEHDDNIVGMCRTDLSGGKSLDYLKFSEILIDPDVSITVKKFFMKKVKMLAVFCGYIKIKVTSNEVMTSIFEEYGWKLDGKKFKFSNDSLNTYSNKTYKINVNKFNYDNFGRLVA